ncbi:MAG: glycosyltransferase family 4 protein [Burkholderiaceae bacterium]|nr:glycosyltransferase family 4 protein [Burkholderiaceae bacterium]
MSQTRRPLKVLLSAYACEPDRGSEPGVGWNWMLALLRRGYHVWVITRANNRHRIEKACEERELPLGSRLHFVYYDLPRWARWWKRGGAGVHLYYTLWQRQIYSLAIHEHRRHRFDVVHHLTFGVWRQTSHLHKLGVPFIFGPVGGGEEAPWALVRTLPLNDRFLEIARVFLNRVALLNPQLRACARKAALVVARTPETAQRLRRFGIDCTVAPDIGIDTDGIVPANETCNGPLRCIYAGRLLGWKGVHLAIDAVRKARQNGAKVTLTIVGRGALRNALEERAVELTADDTIRFVDWLAQGDLFDAYRRHDLLLFPSLHDSGGSVVLEAMAQGLPVVCLGLGGPGAIVDASCGTAVASRGRRASEVIDELASVLSSLFADTVALDQLKRGAYARAVAMNWDRTVQRTYDHIPAETAGDCHAAGNVATCRPSGRRPALQRGQ